MISLDICTQCGSIEYKQTIDGTFCVYCNARRLVENPTPHKTIEHIFLRKLFRAGAVICLIIVGEVVISAGATYAINNFIAGNPIASAGEYGLNHIEEVRGWSRDNYDSIVIATYEHDTTYGITKYSGGTNFNELQKNCHSPIQSLGIHGKDEQQ